MPYLEIAGREAPELAIQSLEPTSISLYSTSSILAHLTFFVKSVLALSYSKPRTNIHLFIFYFVYPT